MGLLHSLAPPIGEKRQCVRIQISGQLSLQGKVEYEVGLGWVRSLGSGTERVSEC